MSGWPLDKSSDTRLKELYDLILYQDSLHPYRGESTFRRLQASGWNGCNAGNDGKVFDISCHFDFDQHLL